MATMPRPIIGSIAMRWGWLDQNTIRHILNYRVNGRIPMFGERGIKLGLFTPYQVRIMLAFQRSKQKKFGQFFVETGIISQQELERLVMEMKEHNARVERPQVGM